jgi:hypothetical protein
VRRGLWRFQIERGRKMRLSDHRARRRDPDRVEVLAIVGAAHVPELDRSPRQFVKPEAVQRFLFKRYIVAQIAEGRPAAEKIVTQVAHLAVDGRCGRAFG